MKQWTTTIHEGMKDAPTNRPILVGALGLGPEIMWKVIQGSKAGYNEDDAYHWSGGKCWCELPGEPE